MRCQVCGWYDGSANHIGGCDRLLFGNASDEVPVEPSLCWDVKVGWVPVREIDPATGRTYTQGPGTEPGPQETPQ